MTKKIGRYLGLGIVTGLAAAIAVCVTVSGWSRDKSKAGANPDRVIPKTPVSVMTVEPESIEITDSYSGMIRPFERFSLGFAIAGRVDALGTNAQGKPLDEGDRVTRGQVLAELDARGHRARVREIQAQQSSCRARLKDTKARLEQAQANMRRADELRGRQVRAITDTEYQEYVTALVVAQAGSEQAQAALLQADAQLAGAQKDLEDTRLVAPVAGTISKRLVNAGESVGAHQVVMEIIQLDEVLLTVGVPEAYVGAVRVAQPVTIELLARNRFRQRRPSTKGRVYRIAEAADQTTGLFEVEIILKNEGGRWRPGLIALGHIVIDRVEGFRIPTTCAVFRDDETFLFVVDAEGKARRVELNDWIEQAGDLIVGELPPQWRTIVRRGQHRLVEGRQVEIIRLGEERPAELKSPPTVRTPAKIVGAEPVTER